MVTIPLAILAAVVVVMSVVTAMIVRGGGTAKDLDHNRVVIWSPIGFIDSIGVQAVSASLTRRPASTSSSSA